MAAAVAAGSVLFVGLAVTSGAPARGETLIQALIAAYKTNPRIRSARAQLRETDEQAAQAISNWRPTISATGEISRRFSRSRTSGITTSTSNLTPRSISLSLSQFIWRGGRNFAQLRQAEGNIRAQRARLLSAEQTVFFEVVSAYMNVVRDLAVVRLSEANISRLARQLQATRDRFSVGEVTRTDVAQAQARLASARSDLIQAEGTLQNSRASYRNLVGHLPGKLLKPKRWPVVPRSRVTVIRQARRYNPDVVAALYSERAAYANVDLVRGELLPTLSIGASVSRSNSNSVRGTTSNSASVTATVTIPLYASGSVTSRLRAAKQAVFRLKHDRAQTYRTATENATRTWHNYRTASAQVRSFQSQVRANSIALEGVRQEARAGLRTVLDVLDAQQELFQSQVNLVRAERDQVVAAYEVWSAMGRLTARQLRLPVKFFNPKAYYKAVKWKIWGLGPSIGEPPVYRLKKK